MPLSDADIRKYIIVNILNSSTIDPDTIIVEELDLCQGESRIDLAVINGTLSGIEIKSDRDTLERLEHQIKIYGKNLDQVKIFVSKRWAKDVSQLVPEWWGITELSGSRETIKTRTTRRQKKNPNVDPFSIVQLLWRNEALNLLEINGLGSGLRFKSRNEIWKKVVENIKLKDLRNYIRFCLKNRKHWRFVHRRMLNDGLYQPGSML